MIHRMCLPLFCLMVVLCLPYASNAETDLQRVYVPAPDEIIIYNADMAQLTQRFIVQGDESFRVELPQALLPNTLRVRVDGRDVSVFRLTVSPVQGGSYSHSTDFYNYNPYYGGNMPQVERYWLEWDNAGLDASEVHLTCLAHGISWEARYMCDILDEETSHLHYAAAIDNRLLDIHDCRIRLLSGIVAGINQADWNNMNATQRAGMLYNVMGESQYGDSTSQVTLNIHEIYDVAQRSLERGKLTSITLFDGLLDHTKHLVWDAREDREKAGKVKVIYKIMNETERPFAAGTVQMYEDDIFIGMDPMELTPVGSPGHITVGESMDFRVFRYQKDEYISERPAGLPGWVRNKHLVTLEIRYFGDDPATLEILDSYRPTGYSKTIREEDGEFVEDTRYDNILQFEVRVKKGDVKTIEYIYYTG